MTIFIIFRQSRQRKQPNESRQRNQENEYVCGRVSGPFQSSLAAKALRVLATCGFEWVEGLFVVFLWAHECHDKDDFVGFRACSSVTTFALCTLMHFHSKIVTTERLHLVLKFAEHLNGLLWSDPVVCLSLACLA